MKKSSLNIALAAALTIAANTSFAKEIEIEKCRIVKNNKGLIKAGNADCATSAHTCAGKNGNEDIDAWIIVPKGECEKINNGDFSGINNKIKSKIDIDEFNSK
ncbi:MAG: DUF2282 domain-containing protein [Proteobacteria bacterium]|nr:DUF2282 domain-containing protein [Pseudomonadota bacterium]